MKEQQSIEKQETFLLKDLQRSYYYGRNGSVKEKPIFLYTTFSCEHYDTKRMETAICRVIENCDALRCRILSDGTQTILPWNDSMHYEIPVEDISKMSAEKQQEWLEKRSKEIMNLDLDPQVPPMMHMEATKISETTTILHLYLDGLIVDWGSCENIFSDLDLAYTHPEKPLLKRTSFQEYVEAVFQRKETAEYQKNRKFWENLVDQFPEEPQLPLEENYEKKNHDVYMEEKVFLKEEQWHAVTAFAAAHQISTFAILLTAFCRVVGRYSENEEFLMNVPIPFRPSQISGVETVTGECSDFILFPYHPVIGETILEEARRLEQEWNTICAHQPFYGTDVIDIYQRKNDVYNKMLAPVVFTDFTTIPEAKMESLVKKRLNTHTSQIWLDLVIYKIGSDVVVNFDSSKNILKKGILSKIAKEFQNAVLLIPEWNGIKEFPLLKEDIEKIEQYNRTDATFSKQSYAELIQQSMNQFAGRPAICCEDHAESYQTFFTEVQEMIGFLDEFQIELHKRIAVLLGKGKLLLLAAQGIVLSGHVYAPLDYDYPIDVLENCLNRLDAKLIITDDKWYGSLKSKQYPVLHVKDIALSEQKKADFKICQPNDPVVVIHTSGSTGLPKAAELSHGGLLNCLRFSQREFQVTEQDCILAVTNHCHDMSLYDLFGMFICGASVAIMEQENWMDPYVWRDLMEQYHVTMWNSVPSLMTAFLDILEEDAEEPIQNLRLLIHGGDYFTPAEAQKLWKIHPDLILYNVGGPTEATIWSIYHKITKKDVENGVIPYGRPIHNMKFQLFHNGMKAVPVGVKGLMYISGIGDVSGYIDGRDSEKFVTDQNGTLWYNTGDIGKLTEDAVMLFYGRKDNQIKRFGKRIELDGIENVAREWDGVENVKVLLIQENMELILFYTTSQSVNRSDLKNHMEKELPEYMLPNDYIEMETLPLTHNGKINSKKLISYYKENCQGQQKEVAFQFTKEQMQPIMDLFQQCLHLEQPVEQNDNFFRLGGNSLIAMQFISEVKKKFYSKIELSDIFSNPIIGVLCDHILQTASEMPKKSVDHHVVMESDCYRLTPVQKILFISNLTGKRTTFTILTGYIEIHSPVQVENMKKAIQYAVEQYDALHFVFGLDEEGEPYQKKGVNSISAETIFDVVETDSLKETIKIAAQNPLDLTNGISCHFTLAKDKNRSNESCLIAVIHHIVADEQAFMMIFEDIMRIYDILEKKGTYQKKNQGSDKYGRYLVQKEHSNHLETISYWDNLFQNDTVLECPIFSASNHSDNSDQGKTETFFVSATEIQKYESICQKNDVTLFTGLLSAIVISLCSVLHQKELSVFIPFTDRIQYSTDQSFGMYIDDLLIYNQIKEQETFADFLKSEMKTFMDAYQAGTDAMYASLKKQKLEQKYFKNRMKFPFFDLMNADRTEIRSESLSISQVAYYSDENTAERDLSYLVEYHNDNYEFRLGHILKFVSSDTAKLLIERFQMVLREAIENENFDVASFIMHLEETKEPPKKTAETLKKQVQQAWKEVLNVEEIGDDVNFFDAGGYSFLLYKLNAALKKQTGLKVPFMDLMEYTTIQSMSDHLLELEDEEESI